MNTARVAMIGRAENRGLGIQTWEFFRHVRPAKTLLLTLGDLAGGFEAHVARYSEDLQAGQELRVEEWHGGEVSDAAIAWLLGDVDVLYTAETPYDYRILEHARAQRVASIVQPNYEFCRWNTEDLPRPDLFAVPSSWHFEDVPGPKVHLPFPVDRDRCAFQLRTRARRFLHVGGRRAHLDRNGTRLVLQAVRHVRARNVEVLVRTQDRVSNARGARVRHEDAPDYWRLYDGADVLIAPRRYGGQSLPMNEALSCGLPVISLDVEPQRQFLPPASLVPVTRRGHVRTIPTQGGPVEFYEPDPRAIARKIEELAANDSEVQRLSEAADNFAASISWEALLPRYWQAFEYAAVLRELQARAVG